MTGVVTALHLSMEVLNRKMAAQRKVSTSWVVIAAVLFWVLAHYSYVGLSV